MEEKEKDEFDGTLWELDNTSVAAERSKEERRRLAAQYAEVRKKE